MPCDSSYTFKPSDCSQLLIYRIKPLNCSQLVMYSIKPSYCSKEAGCGLELLSCSIERVSEGPETIADRRPMKPGGRPITLGECPMTPGNTR